MKRYCSNSKCNSEFDINNQVSLCPDCAVGSDAWLHWFVLNDPRFVLNDATRPMFESSTGRIRQDCRDAVHRIIDADGGIVNFANIDRAAKFHLQTQADAAEQEARQRQELARQRQEAAESLARQQQAEQQMLREFREFKAGQNLAARLQAGQKQTIIQRVVAKLRKMISSPLPS